MACPEDSVSQHSTPFSSSYILSASSSAVFPKFCWGHGVQNVSQVSGLTTKSLILCSLISYRVLRWLVCTRKKKLLCPRLQTAQAYRYWCRYLEGNLKSWSQKKKKLAYSTLGISTCDWPCSFDHASITRHKISSVKQIINPFRKCPIIVMLILHQ